MQKIIICLVLSLLIVGFSRASDSTETDDMLKAHIIKVADIRVAAIKGALKAAQAGVTALNEYLVAPSCDEKNAKIVKSSIMTIGNHIAKFDSADPDDSGDATNRKVRRQMIQWHTDLSFNFSDEALSKKCLDDADKVDRGLVRFYIGQDYGGIRDRAKLGIEDIRDARTK